MDIQASHDQTGFWRFVKGFFVLLGLALMVGGVWFLLKNGSETEQANTQKTGNGLASIKELENNQGIEIAAGRKLIVNGPLEVNSTLVLAPQSEPENAQAGQLYFDKGTQKLTYFDGEQFVLLGGSAHITSGSDNLVVMDDGNGNVVIANASSGGSSLSVPVRVVNGGTGASSLALNGVIIGNGTSALGSVTASGAGLCFMSTSGAPAFAACPSMGGGNSSAFVQDGNSFGSAATLGTNDAFALNFETSGVAVGTLSATGAATFQNASNSTGGFQVLNQGSVPQFVIDTSASRLYVGNPTGDTTGALLVLDAKNNSGDPTGVSGAMYYNSNLGQFRCYEVDFWRDCVESPRTGFRYTNDLLGSAADSYLDFASNNGNFFSHNAEPRHPGIQELNTLSGGPGTYVWLVPRSSSAEVALLGNGDVWRHETVARITTAAGGLSTGTQRYGFRTGFVDNATDNNGDGTNGCFFRYSDNINSGKWQGTCRDNTTESVCDTTITVAVDTWYRLTVVVNAAGNSVDFRIDGTSRCQVTTNIPTATGRETNWGTAVYKDVGSTSRSVEVDYFEVTAQFGASR